MKLLDPTFGGNVIPIRSKTDALTWGRDWQRYAEKMEMLYQLAGIQRDMSSELLKDALAECERLRSLIGEQTTV